MAAVLSAGCALPGSREAAPSRRPQPPRVVATAAEFERLVAYADPKEGVLYAVLPEVLRSGRWQGLELDWSAGRAFVNGAALRIIEASAASVGPREPAQGATRFVRASRRVSSEASVSECARSSPANTVGAKSDREVWRRYESFEGEGLESGTETWMNVMRMYGWPVLDCPGTYSVASESYDTWVVVAGPFPL